MCRTVEYDMSSVHEIVGTLTVPWSDSLLASTTAVITSSTMVVLTLFLPLPGRTPSCPGHSNFTIISVRACSDIGPRRCFLKRRNSLTMQRHLWESFDVSKTRHRCGGTIFLAMLSQAMKAFCNARLIVTQKTSSFYCAWHLHMLLRCAAAQRHLIKILQTIFFIIIWEISSASSRESSVQIFFF